MRSLYIIRHGHPAFPEGKTLCIGRTDIPLGRLGRMQAYLAAEFLKDKNISAVYTSPLKRAAQTASMLSDTPKIREGLTEMSMGDWEGFGFGEIKSLWPEVYEKRGEDPSFPIPGAEKETDADNRFKNEIENIMKESDGDIAVITHRAVSTGFLTESFGVSREQLMSHMHYGTVTLLDYDGKSFIPQYLGRLPAPELSRERAEKLLEYAETTQKVIEHCRAAAKLAAQLSDELGLDTRLCESSALLHDIARIYPEHPQLGAAILERLGYARHAEIIRQHHSLDDPELTDEAAVVYIADKLISGSERVSIEERFSKSLSKCTTPEAKAAHKAKYEAALKVKNNINSLCGKELVT